VNLDQSRRLALLLPGVIEKPHFKFTSFRVGGKIFATAPPDDTFLHVFVAEEDRQRWLALKPRVVEKLFWGGKAVGLKVKLQAATPGMVRSLLSSAWANKAPQAMLAASSDAGDRRSK
jgi:hypothetical protein